MAVVAAVEDEVRSLRARLCGEGNQRRATASISHGSLAGMPTVIARTGMGRQAMTSGMDQLLKECHPEMCLHVGYCGGTHFAVAPGDLIIGIALVDGVLDKVYSPSPHLQHVALELLGVLGLCGHSGTLVTIDRVASTPMEKAILGSEHGCLGVDMESAVMAAVCHSAGVPFLVVRAILDPLGFPLPEVGDLGANTGEQATHDPLSVSPLREYASLARREMLAFVTGWAQHFAGIGSFE